VIYFRKLTLLDVKILKLAWLKLLVVGLHGVLASLVDVVSINPISVSIQAINTCNMTRHVCGYLQLMDVNVALTFLVL
jgi:hypothetical protein